MIIERVELENVLSHRRSIISLGRGIIAIVGPNGAGKTSIIDAITYALFGTHSRDPRSKKDSIIRLGTHFARITLDFTHNGRQYRIQKLVSRQGRTETRLFEISDGKPKPVATTSSTVLAELRRILGIDPSVAERLVITRQGQIEEIITNKDKRLDIINSILRLKAIEKAYDRLPYIIRSLQKTVKYKKEALQREEERLKQIKKDLGELEKLQKEAAEAKKLLEIREKKYKELREQVDRLNEELKDVEKRLARLATLRDEYERARRELGELEEKIKALERARDELKAYEEKVSLVEAKKRLLALLRRIEPLRNEVNILNREAENLRRAIAEKDSLKPYVREYERLEEFVKNNSDVERRYHLLNDEINELERRIKEVEKKIEHEIKIVREKAKSILPFSPPESINELLESAHSLLDTLRKQEEKLSAEKERLASDVAVSENRIRELEDKLEKLSTARGVCPLCNRPLSDEERVQLIIKLRREKEQADRRRREAFGKLVQVSKQLEKLREAVAEAEKLVREVEVAAKTVQKLMSELEEHRKRLKEKKSQLLEIYASYKEYQEARERLEKLQEYVLRYKSLIYKESELHQLEKELSVKQEQLEKELRELREVLRELQLSELPDIDELANEINEFTENFAKLKERVRTLEILEHRRDYLISRLADLEKELRELRGLEETRVKLLELLSVKKRELEEIEEELISLRRRLAEIETRIKMLEERRKEAASLENRIQEMRRMLENYEKAQRALEKIKRALSPQGLPRIIREAAKQRLEQSLTEMLNEFNIDFDYVKLDEDYNVYLVTRNGEKNVQMLSGGERIALAIAYRLALARIIGGRVESMIMDEPTVHLDEERRRELISIIKQGLEATGLAQLVVVTHERELEEAADKVVEVRRERDESRVIERLPFASQLVEA